MIGRSARRMLLFVSVALIGAAALAGPAAAAPAGLAMWHDSSATEVGALPAQPMSITLTLTPQNAAGLKALVASPHAALTPAEFNAQYAPARATVTAIRSWATASKLSVASVSANRLLVKLTGSSTAVAAALHTNFARFSSTRDGSFYAPTSTAQLPATLSSKVSAVLGLSSLAKLSVPHPAARSAAGLAKVQGTARATPRVAAQHLADADILATVNRWVTDDSARQGSFSAGECDLLADVSGFTGGLDAVLEAAASQGQTMFFSSGDTGSQCPAVTGVNGVPAGIPDTNYPASSPYGIGVGGTSVLSPTGPTEIAWYAGGGGISPIEPVPAFQSATEVLGAAPLLGRGVPDVSLDADPESGYDVIVSGSETAIGGTSASAPSWQGIWARVQGAHSGGLGFAGAVLYSTEPSTAYHDITLGSNVLYPAGPGYDLTTGLGTPDIAKLVSGA